MFVIREVIYAHPVLFVITCLLLLRISNKIGEKIKIYLVFNFFFEYHVVFEIMWKNIVGEATDDNIAHAYCMSDT